MQPLFPSYLDFEGCRSVYDVWKIEVLNVVTGDDVWVNLTHELRPSLKTNKTSPLHVQRNHETSKS